MRKLLFLLLLFPFLLRAQDDTQGRILYDGMGLSPLETSYVRASARQTALEIANAGVDQARSWSCWVRFSNVRSNTQRVFNVSNDNNLVNQYGFYRISTDNQSTTNNGKARFTSFTTNTAIIEAQTTQYILLNRYYHFVVTYSGSETGSGIKIYVDGVDDTQAVSPTGSYTGGRNDASLRFKIGYETSAACMGGDVRDLAMWNKELSPSEVTELYNNGNKRANSSVSFYAASIISDWPLYTNRESLQNSSYNLSQNSVTGISHNRFSFSTSDAPISFKRATVGNTRYVAFGNGIRLNASTVRIYIRSGTSHVAGGKVVSIDIDLSTGLASAPADAIVDGTYSMSGVTCGIDSNGDIHVFAARYDSGTDTFIDARHYTSTDGGATFDAGEVFSNTRPRFEFYGKMVEGFAPGEYFVPFFEHTSATNWTVSVFKTTDYWATHSKIQVYDGTNSLSEPSVLNLGNNTLLMLMRRFSGTYGIYQSVSTDGGSTWSAPALTNLAPEAGLGANCETAFANTGKIDVGIMDRSTDYGFMSKENLPATILSNPLAWNTPFQIFASYSTDSLNILGYPILINIGNGNWVICFSAEQSSSRADLFFGIGSN